MRNTLKRQQQHAIFRLLLFLLLVFYFRDFRLVLFLGKLFRRFRSLDLFDRTPALIEDLAPLFRLLRRHLVAVMKITLVIHPFVQGTRDCILWQLRTTNEQRYQ
jgi:hypothetical protein